MHMKDDHMRNAQLKPGYNVQIAVDSEYIVAADIFQDRNDVWTQMCIRDSEEDGREGLNLLMVDDRIPAGAKLY